MEWLCAGTGLLVLLSVGGLLALGGLVLLLIKLGVIVRYATTPEPQDLSGDYALDGSKSPRPEDNRNGE
jgi:hypothetical protein